MLILHLIHIGKDFVHGNHTKVHVRKDVHRMSQLCVSIQATVITGVYTQPATQHSFIVTVGHSLLWLQLSKLGTSSALHWLAGDLIFNKQ